MSRNPFLEQLADNHEAQIKRTLEDLEARIVSQISTVTEGADAVSTKIAIELRTDLKRFIDETYRTTADTLVRDYDQIVQEFMKEFGELNIPDNFKTLTQADALTITQLKFQSFQGFEDIASRYLNEISTQVYQNAIAGKPFNEMVKDLRGLITGDVDRRGRPMSTYASQIAHDSVMQFDGQFTIYKAEEAGLSKFKYTGTRVDDTRPFCMRELDRAAGGKTYTKEEVQTLHNTRSGQFANGKAEGDPFIVRGGYRCRHTWLPVSDDFFDAEETQQEDKPKTNQKLKNTFTANEENFYSSFNNNISSIGDVMNKLDGQEISNRKISAFVNAHGITNLLIPRDINKATFRKKEFPKIKERYDKNKKPDHDTEVFGRISDLDINEKSVVYRRRNIKGWATPMHNAPITFVDETVDFKNLDAVAIQANTKKVLDRTKNNKGKYETKGGFKEKKNADWSFSSAASTKEEQALKTMLHELGHHVHYYSYKADISATNTRMNIYGTLNKEQKKNMILTNYGETDKYEVHAELFTAYATNRTALANYNQGLVDYMDNLLEEATKNKRKGY